MKTDHDAVAEAEEPATKADEPAAKAQEPAAKADEPAAKPDDEPAAEATAEPAAEEKPAAEATAEPAADPEPEPAAEATAEPAADPEPEPAAEATAEPAADPEPEPAAEAEAAPAAAPAAEGKPGGASGALGGLFPPRTTKARVLLAAVLVVLIGLGTGGYLWFANHLPEGVALRINGKDVSEKDLDDQVQTLGALYGVRPPTEPDRLDKFRRDVAKSTAVAMVIDDVAAERRIAVADRQVTDYLARYVTQVYGEGAAGREAYVKDLADKGTSEPRVLAELKRQMTIKELLGQVAGSVTVSDEDVRKTFDERKAEFATPERREIQNIVVKTKEEADALVGELNAGGDFAALAGQRSLDGTTRANGGNLGPVSARDLQKGYADAAFGAPVGAVFGPVETQQQGQEGPITVFNVGKVVASQPGAPAEFDKIKDGVKQLVMNERAEAQWRDFVSRSIKDADVDYADKFQPEDPDALPSADNAPPPAQPAPNAPPR